MCTHVQAKQNSNLRCFWFLSVLFGSFRRTNTWALCLVVQKPMNTKKWGEVYPFKPQTKHSLSIDLLFVFWVSPCLGKSAQKSREKITKHNKNNIRIKYTYSHFGLKILAHRSGLLILHCSRRSLQWRFPWGLRLVWSFARFYYFNEAQSSG